MNAAAGMDAGELIFGPLGPRLAELAAGIAAAPDVATLAGLAPAIRGIGTDLTAADAGPGLATRVMAQMNGRLAARVLAIVARTSRLPAAPWCWLSFGSEGRGEQTLVTDQDNGLVFSAAGSAEAHAMRQLFQPFARAVNEALDACGIPLCKGEVMAGNPSWCLSLDEWCQRYSAWIRTPDPTALLNATIFFDFTPLCGDIGLAAQLRHYLLGLTSANDAFIRMMANNALSVAPPLNLLGELAGDAAAGGAIDLKTQGARLFVDAARIFALAAGANPVGTVARLGAAVQARSIGAQDAAAAALAFEQVQQLRLRRQATKIAAGGEADNRVAREDLNEFEYRLLKAALLQARRLQQQMKITFRIEA